METVHVKFLFSDRGTEFRNGHIEPKFVVDINEAMLIRLLKAIDHCTNLQHLSIPILSSQSLEVFLTLLANGALSIEH